MPEDSTHDVSPSPMLRLELGRSASLLETNEAAMLRDELQAMSSPAAARLATQIDVVVTTLLAAPLQIGRAHV